ncbi:MAG TPA: EAL domain-containing response regulator [Steroidobacteraceae bacterium]|nr:EAL domain-containing response regulator [Steroidobacteraceae bacterium]
MESNGNRLLVVDDQPDILDFVGQVAESVGYEVRLANDAKAFREAVRSFRPSLMILDLQMPQTDGIELIRELGAAGTRASILISSGMDQRVLQSAEQLGVAHGLKMAGFLQKPIMLADLEAILGQHLQAPRVPTEDELRRAIDRAQLLVHYQPKCTLADGRWAVVGVEGLIRWEHPELGLVYPDAFIALAEKTGLIAALTDFVLQEGIRQLSLWRAQGTELDLSINLSPHLVRELDFPDQLSDLMRNHGLDNSRLTLEITETAALEDPARTRDILTRLRVKSFGLSLDDFGTGFSSLTQLYRMPFNELKVDKSLGMELHQSSEARTIVRSLVDLAHNLGLRVCTEGVETAAALQFLEVAGSDYVQGYYLGRPVAATAIPPLVARPPVLAAVG